MKPHNLRIAYCPSRGIFYFFNELTLFRFALQYLEQNLSYSYEDVIEQTREEEQRKAADWKNRLDIMQKKHIEEESSFDCDEILEARNNIRNSQHNQPSSPASSSSSPPHTPVAKAVTSKPSIFEQKLSTSHGSKKNTRATAASKKQPTARKRKQCELEEEEELKMSGITLVEADDEDDDAVVLSPSSPLVSSSGVETAEAIKSNNSTSARRSNRKKKKKKPSSTPSNE